MPVQVRTINLKLIKWTQSRVTSYVTHLDTKKFDETVRGHCTALSLRTSDHFGQIAPTSQPRVELLNCSPIPTLTQSKDNPSLFPDPCCSHGSTSSLSTPSLPLPPVLSSQSLRPSRVYNSLHISDLNSTFAKLVTSTSRDVFIARDSDFVTSFPSPLRDVTTCSFHLSGDKPGIGATTVVEVLVPACTKTRPPCSSLSWSNSQPKSQLVSYSCEKHKSLELTCNPSPSPGSSKPPAQRNGPSEEQLHQVKDRLVEVVPNFFKRTHDYRLYNPDIVFINNFWGKETVHRGLSAYMMELSKARILSHIKYAHLQMNIVKITAHPEEGSIRLHWRVTGLPQLKTLQFWKFLPWTYRNSLKSESRFFDGLSTLFIGSDELIYKHKVDRMMPEEEPLLEKSPDLALKLGLMFGLLPRTGF